MEENTRINHNNDHDDDEGNEDEQPINGKPIVKKYFLTTTNTIDVNNSSDEDEPEVVEPELIDDEANNYTALVDEDDFGEFVSSSEHVMDINAVVEIKDTSPVATPISTVPSIAPLSQGEFLLI